MAIPGESNGNNAWPDLCREREHELEKMEFMAIENFVDAQTRYD